VKLPLGGKRGASKYVLVDDAFAPTLGKLQWSLDARGYVQTAVRHNGRKQVVPLHRFLLDMLGLDPAKHVDHENGDQLDCRLSNLRPATQAQNNRNRNKWARATSRYYGVSASSTGGWRASIKAGGQQKNIGVYDKEIDAALAYNRAVSGFPVEDRRFARLNSIEDDGRVLSSRRVGPYANPERGVRKRGGRWAARGWRDGQEHYLGLFTSKDAAVSAAQSFRGKGNA
jgi:hypothetical protein